jgi:hypothetical protein
MKRVEHRVAAAALRLGREKRGQNAAGERADAGQQHEQPRAKGRPRQVGGEVCHELAVRAQRLVAREFLQEVLLDHLEKNEEQRADRARDRPDERCVQQHPPEESEIELGHRCSAKP